MVLAAVLSLGSVIPGIGVTLLIAYGLSLHIAEHQGSGESLMYQMTDPIVLWELLYFAIIPAVPGLVGLWIARRRFRDAGRVSLAGMAARFSGLGLGLSVMIGAMVGVARALPTGRCGRETTKRFVLISLYVYGILISDGQLSSGDIPSLFTNWTGEGNHRREGGHWRGGGHCSLMS